MTIGRDKSSQQLARLRRETPAETDAQVIAYADEDGGQPLALFGEKDSGPYVSPVGDRPSRSDAYNYLVNFKIPLLGDGTGTNTTWADVDATPFTAIDVREWRTIVFNIQYQASRRNTGEAPVVLGQGLFRFLGSFESEVTNFFPPVVLDGTLTTVTNYGDGFRTMYPSDLRTEALAPSITNDRVNVDVTFDVDPYDFVKLLCADVCAAAGPGFQTTYVNGTLNVRYRLVR